MELQVTIAIRTGHMIRARSMLQLPVVGFDSWVRECRITKAKEAGRIKITACNRLKQP